MPTVTTSLMLWTKRTRLRGTAYTSDCYPKSTSYPVFTSLPLSVSILPLISICISGFPINFTSSGTITFDISRRPTDVRHGKFPWTLGVFLANYLLRYKQPGQFPVLSVSRLGLRSVRIVIYFCPSCATNRRMLSKE